MKHYLILTLFTVLSLNVLAAKLPSELVGSSLQDHRGRSVKADELNDKKLIGFYFSAAWCPHCRAINPELVRLYQKHKNDLEIVLVSKDKTAKALQEYMRDARMPWKSIQWGSVEEHALRNHFDAQGIPLLIVVDKQGNLITRDGAKEVKSDARKAIQTWLDKAQTSK